MPVSATPAEEPNQVIEPPKPTAYASIPQSYPPCFRARAVRGILSNTAERKPRPNEVCQDGAGRLSTGIIEAQSTSERRKSDPVRAGPSSDHCGRRIGAVRSMEPMT